LLSNSDFTDSDIKAKTDESNDLLDYFLTKSTAKKENPSQQYDQIRLINSALDLSELVIT
jgi:hypothetical protein